MIALVTVLQMASWKKILVYLWYRKMFTKIPWGEIINICIVLLSEEDNIFSDLNMKQMFQMLLIIFNISISFF